MHRKLSLNTREKILLYLQRPSRESLLLGEDSGPWNTQEGIAAGAGVPIKHVSDALRALEGEKLVRRAKSVHVNGGKRVRRTYLLTDGGSEHCGQIAAGYREREVRVVTGEGEGLGGRGPSPGPANSPTRSTDGTGLTCGTTGCEGPADRGRQTLYSGGLLPGPRGGPPLEARAPGCR